MMRCAVLEIHLLALTTKSDCPCDSASAIGCNWICQLLSFELFEAEDSWGILEILQLSHFHQLLQILTIRPENGLDISFTSCG